MHICIVPIRLLIDVLKPRIVRAERDQMPRFKKFGLSQRMLCGRLALLR